MRILRRTFVTASAMALVAAAGADGGRKRLSRYRTTPQVFCDLPDRDYVHGGPSQPALAISQTALLVRVPGVVPADTLPSGHKMVFYQLKQNELRVEHCSISRVSLAIRDDGSWILSLRADQNSQTVAATPLVAVGTPKPTANTSVPKPGTIVPAASPMTKFTDHIKRNLFTVTVRGYTGILTQGALDGAPGRPVLFELLPSPFWVQKQVALFPRFEGTKAEIAEYFKSIDRVEVELSYR
jgi:hypothetical protein